MTCVAAILVLALTRAEIIERMRAPVITQSEGLVQVYANCPEDMRREYQMPIASFAADTVAMLYRGAGMRSRRFAKPGIVIHVGDVRTNMTDVVTRVSTNDSRVVSRIYVISPGYADLYRLRVEVIKAFGRSVENREMSDREAEEAYERADPMVRIAKERARVEDWLARCGGVTNDEEGLKLVRKVISPGRASRRDVLTFASRLYLYPPNYDLRFVARFNCLSFREALKFAEQDPTIRIMAALKADTIPIFGGGRGNDLYEAALIYRRFLLELGRGKLDNAVLRGILDEADAKLNIAFERAE